MARDPKWWPESPDEALETLVRMRDSLTQYRRDLIRMFSGVIGALLLGILFSAWELGIEPAGWAMPFVLVVLLFAVLSDRFHEAILQIPLTDRHLAEFLGQLKGYELAGLWPPATVSSEA